jgi:hypothetical protein
VEKFPDLDFFPVHDLVKERGQLFSSPVPDYLPDSVKWIHICQLFSTPAGTLF